jgi:hypothetical protein
MYWRQGNLRHMDNRLAKFGDDAHRATLNPNAQKVYQDIAAKRARYHQQYSQYQGDWNKYLQGLGTNQRRATQLAGNLTGMAYDTPRMLSFMPSSSMGAVPSVAMYSVPGVASMMPSSRAGDLAFNAFGNPAKHVGRGFEEGAEGAAAANLNMFTKLNYGERRQFLNDGGLLTRLPGLVDPATTAGFKSNQFGGPGVMKNLVGGASTPEFYHRQAMQKANPYLQQFLGNQGMNKTAAAPQFIGNIGNSLMNIRAAKTALNPKLAVRTAPYVNKATSVNSNMPVLRSRVGPWGLGVGLTGALGYGAYSGARDNAYTGGFQAGQDTALYGMQQGLQNMPAWQKELAALFPEQAKQYALNKYQTMRNGATQGATNAFGPPQGNNRVGYAYTQADGNVVF